MTIQNALIFIKQGMNDSRLRLELNTAAGRDEIGRVLEKKALIFSPHEFEQAFSQKLVQCQEIEEADRLRDFRMWWVLLSREG